MEPRIRNALLLVLGLSLLPSLANAQEQDPPGGSNPVTGKTTRRSQVPVSVPITGVSADEVARIHERVRALRQPLYACPKCDAHSRLPGVCPRCEAPLEEAEHTQAVARAEVNSSRRALVITMQPHHWGSLTTLDALLAEVEGKVQRSAFRIPPRSRVLVSGVEERHANRLRGALVDLELFTQAIVIPEANGAGLWVLPTVEEPTVTIAEFEAVLAELSPDYALADVQWASVCTECGEGPTMKMGEPCRKR